MIKKGMMKEGAKSDIWCSCTWPEILYYAGAIFFGALGFALVIEGLFGQFNIGFRGGFVSYLLGFLFLVIAKHLKWNACRYMCH